MDSNISPKMHQYHINPDQRPQFPGSLFTLCFQDERLEQAFQSHSNRLIETRLSHRVPFCAVFYVVMALEAVAAGTALGSDNQGDWTFYTQLIAIAALSILGGGIFVFAVLVNPHWKKSCHAVVLVLSAFGLSIVDARFAVRISDESYFGGMTSSCMPLLVLTISTTSCLNSHFITYVICVGCCTSIQFCFQASGVRVSSGLIETVLYLLAAGWYSLVVYNNERLLREAFCSETAEYTCVDKEEMQLENWELPEEGLSTELELIIQDLHQAYQIITEVCTSLLPKDPRDKLKESLKRIFQAGKVLKSGRNIHEPNSGFLSKQLDSEYKHYLQQNYLAPHVSEHSRRGSMKPADHQINYGPEDLAPMLNQLEKNWNFDMFFLAQVSGFRPLESTGEFCIKKYNLDVDLNLATGRSLLFFQELERVFDNITELELFGSIIAALGHDIGHPALNNRYLINAKSSFAMICIVHIDNDVSVLEMMHSALTYELLEQTKLLESFTNDQWFKTRKVVTDMILATDMMKHFDLLGSFRVKFSQLSLPLSNFEDRVGMYKFCLKCADVAHAAKAVDLHEKWSMLVVQEFFHQGDLERDRELEISAYCDRYQSDVPMSQCGFIQNIVKPMYEALNALLNSQEIAQICIEQFDQNIAFWRAKASSKKRAHTVKELKHLEEREERENASVKSSSGDLRKVEEEARKEEEGLTKSAKS